MFLKINTLIIVENSHLAEHFDQNKHHHIIGMSILLLKILELLVFEQAIRIPSQNKAMGTRCLETHSWASIFEAQMFHHWCKACRSRGSLDGTNLWCSKHEKNVDIIHNRQTKKATLTGKNLSRSTTTLNARPGKFRIDPPIDVSSWITG